jgi:broad specificity phosphatase PhoE
LLVRHAPSIATRGAVFPDDEALDAEGLAQASLLAGRLPAEFEVLASPARRCRQTAAALGLDPRIEPQISECDFGSWAGRTLAQVHEDDAQASEHWMTDPDAAPHGGESLSSFSARIAAWLDQMAGTEGDDIAAITHGGVIKAAVTHALAAPIMAFWQIEVAPLSVTELQVHNGRWTLKRANCPIGSDEVAL